MISEIFPWMDPPEFNPQAPPIENTGETTSARVRIKPLRKEKLIGSD